MINATISDNYYNEQLIASKQVINFSNRSQFK